jgi:hypothetical protein
MRQILGTKTQNPTTLNKAIQILLNTHIGIAVFSRQRIFVENWNRHDVFIPCQAVLLFLFLRGHEESHDPNTSLGGIDDFDHRAIRRCESIPDKRQAFSQT